MRSRSGGLLLSVVVGSALLVAAIPVGRWEDGRAASRAQRGIDAVRALVGPGIAGPSLSAIATPQRPFVCLLYERGSYIYALELCYDRAGRLVQAVDASQGEARYWSIAYRPSAARVRVDPAQIERIGRFLELRAAVRAAVAMTLADAEKCVAALDETARVAGTGAGRRILARPSGKAARLCPSAEEGLASLRGWVASLPSKELHRGFDGVAAALARAAPAAVAFDFAVDQRLDTAADRSRVASEAAAVRRQLGTAARRLSTAREEVERLE